MSTRASMSGHAGKFTFVGYLVLALLVVAGFYGVSCVAMRSLINNCVEATWLGKTTTELQASWGAPQETLIGQRALRENTEFCSQFDPADTSTVQEALIYHFVPGATYRSANGRKSYTCPAGGKTTVTVIFCVGANGKISNLSRESNQDFSDHPKTYRMHGGFHVGTHRTHVSIH